MKFEHSQKTGGVDHETGNAGDASLTGWSDPSQMSMAQPDMELQMPPSTDMGMPGLDAAGVGGAGNASASPMSGQMAETPLQQYGVFQADGRGGSLKIYPVTPTNPLPGPPMEFQASNNAQNPGANPFLPNGFGPMPTGTFSVGAWRPTIPGNEPSYGSTGKLPVSVPGQTPFTSQRYDLQIHAGRDWQSGTRGCIRTTTEAMDFLREHPISYLVVLPRVR